jgi:cytochrome c oxidase assembly factor CtaG
MLKIILPYVFTFVVGFVLLVILTFAVLGIIYYFGNRTTRRQYNNWRGIKR